jgi:sarcosine oxidase / L-pipecolate oxidase
MKCFENVQKLVGVNPEVTDKHEDKTEPVSFLSSPSAITAVSGTSGASGSVGYINRRSGWVDAEASMRWLRFKVEQTGRVKFITGKVTRLLFSADGEASRVVGALYEPQLEDSPNPDITTTTAGQIVTTTTTTTTEPLTAALTILAAGAWSPSLLDLRGRIHCTAQPLAYLALTPTEAKDLARTPVQMNISTGHFVIPPASPNDRTSAPGSEGEEKKPFLYKVARHSHGLTNPTRIAYPEGHWLPGMPALDETFTVSLPTRTPWSFPPSVQAGLRTFLREVLPSGVRLGNTELASQPFAHTRFCHYADTPTGDFLVDYVPRYGRSLVVATGGSGHGFKFLPVLGDAIVRCIMGERGEVEEKWVWKEDVEVKEDWEWGADDGSRSGEIGVVLDEETGKER